MREATGDAPIRIGILGAGQLALMLAQAGPGLGVEIVCAGRAGDCAEQAARVVGVELDSVGAVKAFAASVDVVTIESENLQPEVLAGLRLFPNAKAVGIAQDRWLEKSFFHACGIGTAPFARVDDESDLPDALLMTGVPAILKTRRMGYDGKGQARIFDAGDAAAAWHAVGGVASIVEGMVAFDAEVSLLGARGRDGEIVFYPLTENHHRDGILRTSIAPYDDARLQAKAEAYMTTLLREMDYVGVLAIEFFVVGDALLANEMAPRVHNSGHWTIEGSATSQFENCLRAIAGMKLGSTASEPTVMLNCIGAMPEERETAGFPMVWRHDYGKAARAGRKVGHLTFPAAETEAIAEWQRRLNPEGVMADPPVPWCGTDGAPAAVTGEKEVG